MRSHLSLVDPALPADPIDALAVPMRRYALQGFLLGIAAAVGWVGWCSLTVATAILLGRWIPLDAALALVGLVNLTTGAGLGWAAFRSVSPADEFVGGMA